MEFYRSVFKDSRLLVSTRN
ncbi:hypothetical protein NOJ16_15455 [Neorhizobium galegae]|nr:hypothetical protein [Neorhizobium galegae]